jgi:hypothetical protein
LDALQGSVNVSSACLGIVNAKLAEIDAFFWGQLYAGTQSKQRCDVADEEPDIDIIRDAETWLLREQAQAMLNLFEEDCGRKPATLEEVRAWAVTQNDASLRSRVNTRLDVILDSYYSEPATAAASPRPSQPTP